MVFFNSFCLKSSCLNFPCTSMVYSSSWVLPDTVRKADLCGGVMVTSISVGLLINNKSSVYSLRVEKFTICSKFYVAVGLCLTVFVFIEVVIYN